jgi:hypothetical protein
MSLAHMMLNPNLSQEFIIEQARLQTEHVKDLCSIMEKHAKAIEDPYERMQYVMQAMPLLMQAMFL